MAEVGNLQTLECAGGPRLGTVRATDVSAAFADELILLLDRHGYPVRRQASRVRAMSRQRLGAPEDD